jgi:tetratricopeptide (TPR) repeat protein
MAHARWKDWPGAVAWCEFTLKIDPENRSVKKTLGFCQAMTGQWDAAFATLSQIMSEAQARHNLAGMLDQMGHTEACKAQLQLALKADPNYAVSAEFLTELQQPREQNNNSLQTTGGMNP